MLDLVFPLPDEVSFVSGAALPMNYLTVHFALVRRGGLRPGETVRASVSWQRINAPRAPHEQRED